MRRALPILLAAVACLAVPAAAAADTYPLSNEKLVLTVKGSEAQGTPFKKALWPLLESLGYTSETQIAQQLASAGWSRAEIEKALSFNPGGLSAWWNSLKQGVLLPIPGGVVAVLAGGGEAGAAGTGAAAAGGGGGAAGAAGKAEQALNGTSNQNDAAKAFSVPALSAVAAGLFEYDAHAIENPTRVDLTGGWFAGAYKTIVDYAWIFGLIALLFFAFQYMLVGWLPGSTVGLVQLAHIPAAALWIVGVPLIIGGMLAFSDLLCQNLISLHSSGRTMLFDLRDLYAGAAAVTAATGIAGKVTGHFVSIPGALWFAAFGVGAAVSIAVELIARELAIYLTVVFLAFAAVASIAPGFVSWRNRLAHGLLVIVFAKFVIVLVLTLGGVAVGSGISHLDVKVLAVGLLAVFVAAVAAPMLYGALLHAAPWHSGAATRGKTVVQPRSTAKQVRQGGDRIRQRQQPSTPQTRGAAA